jgi:hypothetical protein
VAMRKAIAYDTGGPLSEMTRRLQHTPNRARRRVSARRTGRGPSPTALLTYAPADMSPLRRDIVSVNCGVKLTRHANVRPPDILPMHPTGVNRWLPAPLLRVIPALGIRATDLGRAMVRVGLDESWHGSRTLENKDLKALLGRAEHT